tara:strand:- start:16 stop:537 length:522 start_codon:yes stop_codon:yes gene_type:complete
MRLTPSKYKKLAVYDVIQNHNDERYLDSEFLTLKNLSSKAKGAKFEQIVEEMLELKGHEVTGSKIGSDADRCVDGEHIEIKGSFMWKGTDTFRFQQIRDQNYEFVVFLFVYPTHISLKAAYKQDVMSFITETNSKGEFIHNQHGGKKVNSGTYFIDAREEDIPFLYDIDEVFV